MPGSAPELKPPRMGSLGTPGCHSRARSSVPSLQTAIVPRALPRRRIPVCGGRGARAEPPAAPGPASRRGPSWAFKEGVGSPEAANQLGTTSEYADGHPGGQVQHQRLATFPAVSHTHSPWSQTGKGSQVPLLAAQVCRGPEEQFSPGIGPETPLTTQDGELLVR